MVADLGGFVFDFVGDAFHLPGTRAGGEDEIIGDRREAFDVHHHHAAATRGGGEFGGVDGKLARVARVGLNVNFFFNRNVGFYVGGSVDGSLGRFFLGGGGDNKPPFGSIKYYIIPEPIRQ